MRMILRVLPGKWSSCQCILFRDGKYSTVEYRSDGRVFQCVGGDMGNYGRMVNLTNSDLLGLLCE